MVKSLKDKLNSQSFDTILMKHSIITIFFSLTFLISCQQPNNRKNKIVYTVDFNYLEGCETGKGDCKPVTLARHSIQDSIVVIFPAGGTQSA